MKVDCGCGAKAFILREEDQNVKSIVPYEKVVSIYMQTESTYNVWFGDACDSYITMKQSENHMDQLNDYITWLCEE